MKKETLLVTGSSGFIGSYIVEEALKEGYDVKGLDLKENNNNSIEFLKADICNKAAVSKAMKEVDYVIHLAAITSVVEFEKDAVECFNVNVNGFLNILNSAHNNKIKKVIYASSAAVYTGEHFSDSIPLDYSKQHNPYAQSKIMNEMIADYFYHYKNLNTLGLRFFNVFGEGENEKGPYASIVMQFIKNKEKNKPLIIYGDGLQARDFINVKDVAIITRMLLKKSNYGIYNVGTNKAVSYKSIGEIIDKAHIKYIKNPLKSYQYLTKADNSKLLHTIGHYNFIDVKEWLLKKFKQQKIS